jgi:drug/metabolite transporter (DMT)-like permease
VLLEPIMAGILAFFFFKEVPGVLNGVGAVIVLSGIYGYSKER